MEKFTKGLGQFEYCQHQVRQRVVEQPKEDIGESIEIMKLYDGYIASGASVETAKELVKLTYPEAFTCKTAKGEEITLEQLYKWPFDVAHKYILEHGTTELRLVWGDQAAALLGQLYELTKLYGNNRSPKDMERGIIHMSPEEFQRLMNKIKHYETLLGWFYETDMLWVDGILNLDMDEL